MAPFRLSNASLDLDGSDHHQDVVPTKSQTQQSPSQISTTTNDDNSTNEEKHQASCIIHKSDDPFLYYSNDEIRLKTLKYCRDVSEDEVVERKRPVRKTRISFELHSDLVMEDLLEDLYDDEAFADFDDNIKLADFGEDVRSQLIAYLLQL